MWSAEKLQDCVKESFELFDTGVAGESFQE